MTYSAFESSLPEEPHPQPDPQAPAVAGEAIHLELTSTNLRRVRVATEIVHHPGAVVQELHNRLVSGPPKRTTVVVSDRRVSISEKTYRLEHIVSISSAQHAKSVGCALLFVGMGVLMFLAVMCPSIMFSSLTRGASLMSFVGPLVLIGLGYALYQAAKEHYAVHISLSSGEVDGLMSADRDTIAQIYDAIYQALLQRGQ